MLLKNLCYSTTDAVFVLNAVLSSSVEQYNDGCWMMDDGCCGFINLSKAFNAMKSEHLYRKLKQFQISKNLLNIIHNCIVLYKSDQHV